MDRGGNSHTDDVTLGGYYIYKVVTFVTLYLYLYLSIYLSNYM